MSIGVFIDLMMLQFSKWSSFYICQSFKVVVFIGVLNATFNACHLLLKTDETLYLFSLSSTPNMPLKIISPFV